MLMPLPDRFITRHCLQGLVSSLSATFSQHTQGVLRGERSVPIAMDGLLSLLETASRMQALSASDLLSLLPNTFIFAFLLPLLDTQLKPEPSQCKAAQALWKQGWSQAAVSARDDVLVHLKQTLRDVIGDCSIPLRYGYRLAVAS